MTVKTRGRDGIIAGYLLKLARESVGCTQADMAERLAFDPHTLHSWETGRRSLAATNVRDLVQLKLQLFNLGVDPALIDCLDTALEADYLLTAVLDSDPTQIDLRRHPLTSWLLPHSVSEMLAWPVTGTTPSAVTDVVPKTARRGPVSPGPELSAPERAHFFSNLTAAADLLLQQQESGYADDEVLAHQLYLRVGWNDQPEAEEWLRRVYDYHLKRYPKFERWSPRWLERRSLVMALASHGDPEPAQRFIRTAHGSDECEMANLNYWAYWAGEIRDRRRSQGFMVDSDSLRSWTGITLVRRLSDKLISTNPILEFNIHSIAVLLRRPLTTQMLEHHSDIAASIQARVSWLLDHHVPVSDYARTELDFIHDQTARFRPAVPAKRVG